ncbi:MAG: peptide ABC transporter substrate-binding protein [Candidatus Eremiobacteraeota bacterium]|nr:peptide ABC transporter substrate-binding protein [Candidatus Eremiobacteraeota bacterium]
MFDVKKLAGLILLMVFAGCTKAGTGNETGGKVHNAFTHPHYLRYADGGGDLATLNPVINSEVRLNWLTDMTMAYLVRYDHDNRPVPELVTVVPTQANGGISKDGKTITWHIRRGVKWSDGAPFDADDVVFSTKVVQNPANNVIGRDGWDLITRIDEPDRFTVVYHLSKPYSSYLPTFFGTGGANPCVLPKHLLGNLPNINQAPYNSKPVGIGPFRVVRWKRGDSIDMEANPYYWRGQPKLKRVTYKLIPDRNTLLTQLQTGEVDLWPLVGTGYIDRTKQIQSYQTDVVPSYAFRHVDFNLKNPILQDLRVRQALRFGLDRKMILEKSAHGYGILQETMVSPTNPYFDKDVPLTPFDPAKAKQLLDQAGWRVGLDGVRVKNGQRLAFDFASYTGTPDTDQQIELIRASWKEIGVQINLRKYAVNVFFANPAGIVYGGKFDITIYSWGGDPNADLSNLYQCNQAPPSGQNMMHYCNKVADAAMVKAKQSYDPRTRAEYVDTVQEQVIEDVPTVVLYVLKDGFAYNRDLIGFTPNQVSAFDDIMNVDI